MDQPSDIVQRAEMALAGTSAEEWTLDPHMHTDHHTEDLYWDVDGSCGGWVAHVQELVEAQFIANAGGLVTELIAEIRRLRVENKALADVYEEEMTNNEQTHTDPDRIRYETPDNYDAHAIVSRRLRKPEPSATTADHED